jgi:zinc finger protein
MDQPLRRIQDEGEYTKIQALIDKLVEVLDEDDENEERLPNKTVGKDDKPFPAFTIKLDDPAGNSWIEFIESIADPKWNMRTYPRSLQHNIALGLVAAEDEQASSDESRDLATITADEVFVFPGNCSSCGHPLNTLMKKVNIPYFKVSDSVSVPHTVLAVQFSNT